MKYRVKEWLKEWNLNERLELKGLLEEMIVDIKPYNQEAQRMQSSIKTENKLIKLTFKHIKLYKDKYKYF